jgi:beta-xylosidase
VLGTLWLTVAVSHEVDSSAESDTVRPVVMQVIADRAEPALDITDLPPADPEAPALIATPGANVPNPFVLVDEGRYYMYSSQVRFEGESVPLRISDDPRRWDGGTIDALPSVPLWASHGVTWAPDVRRIDDSYVMYLTAQVRDREPRTQCIGVAVGDRAEGPFAPAPDPLVCQLDRGGSIDPRSFVDDAGDLWLHWKSDDNSDVEGSATASIYAQRLAPDGTSLLGEPTRVLEVDQGWEGRIVEAPQMVAVNGDHWLIYSGNWFNQPEYALGLARCEGPAGPCTKPLDGPWLDSNGQGTGPGEGSVFVDLDGAMWLAYSPINQDYVNLTPRPVALARLGFGDLGPYLATTDPDG